MAAKPIGSLPRLLDFVDVDDGLVQLKFVGLRVFASGSFQENFEEFQMSGSCS